MCDYHNQIRHFVNSIPLTYCQIYTVDMRNHGNSGRHDNMSYESMSRDVDSLLVDELNIDSALVLGHSMGGKVAMMLAINRVSMSVLYSPSIDLLHSCCMFDSSKNHLLKLSYYLFS